jgi:hypothetical protein
VAASRASGGIGRRARFRSVCPKGRGGSTPPSRTCDRPRVLDPGLRPFPRQSPRAVAWGRRAVSGCRRSCGMASSWACLLVSLTDVAAVRAGDQSAHLLAICNVRPWVHALSRRDTAGASKEPGPGDYISHPARRVTSVSRCVLTASAGWCGRPHRHGEPGAFPTNRYGGSPALVPGLTDVSSADRGYEKTSSRVGLWPDFDPGDRPEAPIVAADPATATRALGGRYAGRR